MNSQSWLPVPDFESMLESMLQTSRLLQDQAAFPTNDHSLLAPTPGYHRIGQILEASNQETTTVTYPIKAGWDFDRLRHPNFPTLWLIYRRISTPQTHIFHPVAISRSTRTPTFQPRLPGYGYVHVSPEVAQTFSIMRNAALKSSPGCPLIWKR